MRYILALDQGTTSSRAVAFDETGRMVGSHGIEFPQHYPHPAGWSTTPKTFWTARFVP